MFEENQRKVQCNYIYVFVKYCSIIILTYHSYYRWYLENVHLLDKSNKNNCLNQL